MLGRGIRVQASGAIFSFLVLLATGFLIEEAGAQDRNQGQAPVPAVGQFDLGDPNAQPPTLKPACGIQGLKPCDELLPGLTRAVRKTLHEVVNAVYQGKSLNLVGTTEADRFSPLIRFQTPICNLGDKVSTPPDNMQQNHLEQSCGKPCEFTCSQPADKSRIDCGLKEAADSCSAERAYTRGVFVQLIWAKMDEVLDELYLGRKLNLTPRCAVTLQSAEFANVVAKIRDGVASWIATNKDRPVSCDPSLGQGASADSPEQVGCYLTASRAALETVIGQVAVCEVMARTDDTWLAQQMEMNAVSIPRRTVASASSAAACIPAKVDLQRYERCLNDEYKRQLKESFMLFMGEWANAPKER